MCWCFHSSSYQNLIIFRKDLCIYLAVAGFVAVWELSLVAGQASHFSGFSCSRAWAHSMRASVVAARRLSSCVSQALVHWASSYGTWI